MRLFGVCVLMCVSAVDTWPKFSRFLPLGECAEMDHVILISPESVSKRSTLHLMIIIAVCNQIFWWTVEIN